MNRLIVFSIVAAALLSIGSRGAYAEDVTRPSGRRIAEGDWTFVALVSRSGDEVRVPGVLALRDKASATGDNIVAVWFERPEDPESEWPSKAWPGQDHWECIKYLKEQHGIGDEWDFLWPTNDQLTAQSEAKVPWDYERGLFTSDPLAGLVYMPNRDDILWYLTELGYKSADLVIERIASGVQCGARQVLNA